MKLWQLQQMKHNMKLLLRMSKSFLKIKNKNPKRTFILFISNIVFFFLLFHFNRFPKWHGEDRHNAILTFNNIDWDKFFSIDNNKKIQIKEFLENISNSLYQSSHIKWPYLTNSNINVSNNIKRDIQTDQLLSIPLFKCLPHSNLSYTLKMSISPWCLFVNTLQFDIKIQNLSNNDFIKIDAGKIGMLFPIEDSFILDLYHENSDTQDNNALLNKISLENLQQNGILEMIFIIDKIISKILIEYNFNDGLRIITLSSVFNIVNFTDYKIYAYPFCLKNDEKINRYYLEKEKQLKIDISNESSRNTR